MEEPESQLQLHVTDCRDTRIIGRIRDSLLSRGCTINPPVIEGRIKELFPSFDTPTHPPYALMIQRAVTDLNDQNGSTEEAISEFIKKEFQDLPWAHTRILSLHLGKLCQAEDLLRTESGGYKLMVDCDNFDERKETGWRGSNKRKKGKTDRNHRGRETLEGTEGTERSYEVQERENEEQNQLSELHGTGTNQMIEEQEKSEIGLLGMTEECHGRVFQAQVEAETPQNKNTGERTQEAIRELNDKIRSSEIMNTEPHMGEKQNSMVIKKHIQCEKQPYNLLAVAENQTRTQQIEVTTEISRFCPDEVSNNENLSASLGSPTTAVIPKEKFQISEQEEQPENETPSIPQKFSGACELLLDQEGPTCHLETSCSSQPTAPDLPVDLTSNSWSCLTVPVSTEFLEYTPSDGIELTEFLEYTPSEGIELTPTQLLMQTSNCGTSETDLCTATKTLASLSSMTVHEYNQPQDWIPGNPKGRMDLQPQGQGSGGGKGHGGGRGMSPKPDRNLHQHLEQLQLQDQALDSVSFPSLEPDETSYSSLAPIQQQLGDPTSEESPGCIPLSAREVSAILQTSWHRLMDGDLDTTSKMEDSLFFMNVYEDKLQQHGNEGVPNRKLNLDGKTDFGHLEQQPPKRRRRGRPPKLNCIEGHSELWPQDQAQGQVHSPNLPDDNNRSREQSPKLKSREDRSCHKQMVLPHSSSQVRGRRELQQLKLSMAYQSHQQLQLETCQGQGRRLLRSCSTKSN